MDIPGTVEKGGALEENSW